MIAALTALSESLSVTTCSKGKTATYHFQRGREVRPAELGDTRAADATTLVLRLDREVLGDNVHFHEEPLRAALARVRELLPEVDVIWSAGPG